MSRFSQSVVPALFFLLGLATVELSAGELAPPTLANDSKAPSVEQELKEIQELAKELNRRVQRLEALISYQKAVDARNQLLKEWRELKVQSGNTPGAEARIQLLEEKFFAERELAEQRLIDLHRLSK